MSERPTVDTLKLARDGHLWVARYADNRWVRPLYERTECLPNGNVLATFADGSAIEYGRSAARGED